jgi:hypothetical protein
LMVVDGDPGSLRALGDALCRRYGQDYLIISETSPAAALGRLRELGAAGTPVAMVMAPAAEFLAQVRTIQPTAERVLVVPRGDPAAPGLRVPVPLVADPQAGTPVLRAIAHGMIERLPSRSRHRRGRGVSPGHYRIAGGMDARRRFGSACGADHRPPAVRSRP